MDIESALQTHAQGQRDSVFGRYLAALQSFGSGNKESISEVTECARLLGRSDDDIAADHAMLARQKAARELVAEQEKHPPNIVGACEAFGQFEQWAAAERKKLDDLIVRKGEAARAEWDQANYEAQRGREAAGTIRDVDARLEAIRRNVDLRQVQAEQAAERNRGVRIIEGNKPPAQLRQEAEERRREEERRAKGDPVVFPGGDGRPTKRLYV